MWPCPRRTWFNMAAAAEETAACTCLITCRTTRPRRRLISRQRRTTPRRQRRISRRRKTIRQRRIISRRASRARRCRQVICTVQICMCRERAREAAYIAKASNELINCTNFKIVLPRILRKKALFIFVLLLRYYRYTVYFHAQQKIISAILCICNN